MVSFVHKTLRSSQGYSEKSTEKQMKMTSAETVPVVACRNCAEHKNYTHKCKEYNNGNVCDYRMTSYCLAKECNMEYLTEKDNMRYLLCDKTVKDSTEVVRYEWHKQLCADHGICMDPVSDTIKEAVYSTMGYMEDYHPGTRSSWSDSGRGSCLTYDLSDSAYDQSISRI